VPSDAASTRAKNPGVVQPGCDHDGQRSYRESSSHRSHTAMCPTPNEPSRGGAGQRAIRTPAAVIS
jgi:hypothetical protein